MTEDQALGLVYGALVLVLVGSALVVRRLDGPRMMRMALAWLAIFAAALALATLFGLHM